MTTHRSCLTIGLLWHSFSSDNLGVGALSESQVAICESAAQRAGVDLRFIVFGTTGGRDYTPVGKNIRIGSPISLKQLVTGRAPFLRELEECDLVLDVGEGDSFTDIYGMRRFRVHIASKIAVLLKRKPLILSPQTIGPFNKWYSRLVAKLVMKRCTHVFSRDGLSSKYLSSIGVIDNVSEAIDIAFRLPYTKQLQEDTEVIHIGLNVSGLLFSGGYSGDNQFGLTLDYQRLVRELLQAWSGNRGVEVWLIPHVLTDALPMDDDRVAIEKLIQEFPRINKAPEFKSPSEAKSFISSMDFLTGARMHACIAALSSGVPVVPIAYSRKFNGLFGSLNYDSLVDGKIASNSEAFDALQRGLSRRIELKQYVAVSKKLANEKLLRYEDYLYELMKMM